MESVFYGFETLKIMDILEEARVMLDLAIHNLSKAGYDTEHFERTVSKIKAEQQVSEQFYCFDDIPNERERCKQQCDKCKNA